MDVHSTYGSAFVGLIAASILYGATLVQTYIYFKNGSRESVHARCTVALLCILDTVHLILCIMALYWHLITNFSNIPSLEHLTWSMNVQTGFNGLIALIVECFFARRVYIFSKNTFIAAIIVILSCFHFSLSIVFTLKSFRLGSMGEFQQLIWVTSAGNGSLAAADILIAASLCFYLYRSRTGYERTNSLINTLIVYSVATGLVSSLIGIVTVITFAVRPNNYIWLAFSWIGGKCYVNSLLALLNYRGSHRGLSSRKSFPCLSPSQVASTRSVQVPPPAARRGRPKSKLLINVQTSTITKTEDGVISPIESASSDRPLFSAV